MTDSMVKNDSLEIMLPWSKPVLQIVPLTLTEGDQNMGPESQTSGTAIS